MEKPPRHPKNGFFGVPNSSNFHQFKSAQEN